MIALSSSTILVKDSYVQSEVAGVLLLNLLYETLKLVGTSNR